MENQISAREVRAGIDNKGHTTLQAASGGALIAVLGFINDITARQPGVYEYFLVFASINALVLISSIVLWRLRRVVSLKFSSNADSKHAWSRWVWHYWEVLIFLLAISYAILLTGFWKNPPPPNEPHPIQALALPSSATSK